MITVETVIDGDFASEEVTRLRDEADIIVTNPPFSLFRKFLAWIMEGGKQFLILGHMNAVGYKEVFHFIKDERIWLGCDGELKDFLTNDGTEKTVPAVWFTNIQHPIRHFHLQYLTVAQLVKLGYWFNRYYNYYGIDIPEISKIPIDYDGVMGVPLSYLKCHNPEQFEIVGLGSGNLGKEAGITKNSRGRTDLAWYDTEGCSVEPFKRILIRSRLGENNEQRSS